jgi:hypothetical protein
MCFRTAWVRLGKARGEHNESGVHPKADLGSICETNAEGNGYFVARGAAVPATCSVSLSRKFLRAADAG